ncbi:FxLYD domain-containing protein [Streptomyces sp. Je 1-332]|uniref:FxLYD domain-containing protein n=1 Tax=Streptomyces sp. Je 1-332 TaxID=3231270 RepID=UPI0034597A8B
MNPMPLSGKRRREDRGRRRPAVSAALTLAATVTAAAALVSCGSDSDEPSSANSRTVSDRPTAPDSSSFSEKTASPLKSQASEAAESARASASEAEASASERADEFEASVSADTERANQAAESALKGVDGRGNAMPDVSMTGKPRSETGGVLASVVTFTNRTDKTADFAVQVDFVDASGKVVETRYVGTQNLEPGKRAQRYAISHEPPEPKLSAKLVKAQRY